MIPTRVIHTHGHPRRETEQELFTRLAAERRRARRAARRSRLLRRVSGRIAG
ncbi:MAG TPA: hypothetical protein VFJ66_05260 [Gaiellales bacterium]|nr:hypothetical protein [Gaiellales bacterium]